MTSSIGDVINEDVTECEVNIYTERNIKSLWKRTVFYKVNIITYYFYLIINTQKFKIYLQSKLFLKNVLY